MVLGSKVFGSFGDSRRPVVIADAIPPLPPPRRHPAFLCMGFEPFSGVLDSRVVRRPIFSGDIRRTRSGRSTGL